MAETKPAETIPANKHEYVSLRTEADLVDANERLVNGFLSGSIESTKALAIAKLLKGSTYLLAELPIRKLNLLAKLQIKNITVPEKLLEGLKK